ncbi:MAG: trypsin-like peptidase domain-containing protein [Planctomycetota bacterium]
MVTLRFTYALLGAFALGATVHAQRVEVLDFYLPTCPPCRAMEPTVDRLAAQGVPIRKIDGSADNAAARRFGVHSYPTFVTVAGGREIGRIEGATDLANLVELVTKSQQIAARSTPAVASPVSQSLAASKTGPRAFAVGADHGPGLEPLPPIPAARPANAAPSSSAAAAPLLAATVRLTVEDPGGRAYGTGTVVDARDGAALVVTCAHLFRDADGRPIDTEGKLSLELFDVATGAPQPWPKVVGHLVTYDFDADVALVSFWIDRDIATAPIASVAQSPRVGDAVRSVGCDLGAVPTVRDSRVVDLDRYQGPPNIETTGAPVQGRSGGGLFDAAGRLIGVCFAADEPADEGLYAGLASVHKQLAKVGLESLYAAPAAAIANAASRPSVSSQPPADSASQLAPVVSAVAAADAGQGWPAPVIRGQAPMPEPPNTAASDEPMTAEEQAALTEITRRAEASEVVLMIRGRQPGATTEVVTIDAASPAFVAAVRSLGERTPVQ